MRYLVSGGAGFLGTNLCIRLLQEGHEVVALDDLSSGTEDNLKKLKEFGGFGFTLHDIVRPLPDVGKVDYVYNLACPASPPKYQRDPVQTFRTSVWGAWNILQYASKENVPVFHTSTSEVYGDPLEHPQAETYWGHVNPIGARACYDEGKRAAETLLFDFARKTGLEIKVVRIFNTYGPHMDPDDGRVVSNIITQALAGKPVTIHGNGRQTRSFCYVDDLMDGFGRMEKMPKDFAGPVNLGNPQERTVLELVKEVEKEIGAPIEIRYRPLPQDDPKRRKPDISLAKEKLGWEPKTPLPEGIRRTVSYFRGLPGRR